MDSKTKQTLEHIAASIRDAGYDPYAQIYGYLKTGDETYITRTGDARGQIRTIDREQLRLYMESLPR